MSRSDAGELGALLERLMAAAFVKAGWKLQRRSAGGGSGPDFLVRRGSHRFAVELKCAREARRDRAIPLLAQAILQAESASRRSGAGRPLAVVGFGEVPESLAADLQAFATEHAPDVAVGVIDLEGFRSFRGAGLDLLNARPRRERPSEHGRVEVRANLFSDLNQWMLKVLLAPAIPVDLLSAPRLECRNASDLARAAGVSIMSAFRLLRLLGDEGFLERGNAPLRIVRAGQLLERWRAAYLRPVREWPVRWVIRGDPEAKLREALSSPRVRTSPAKGGRMKSPAAAGPPRACLGLFAAAEALGMGLVKGVKPHVYLKRLRPDALESLGLMHSSAGGAVDLFVRVPPAQESVFRGAVERGGVPVSDVIQVWADVSGHPARGAAQADEIERRLLGLVASRR